MIESYLRPTYQKLCVDPFARLICYKTHIRPDSITIVALLAGIAAALVLWLGWWPLMAIGLLLLSGYLDTLDGSLARLCKISSDKGAVMDIVGDRIVEFSIILALYSVAPVQRGLPALWMLGASMICVVSFLVVALFIENTTEKSFHYSRGLMERTEAFAFFIVMMLKPAWFISLAWVYTVLVLTTAVYRVFQFVKSQKHQEGDHGNIRS